MEEILKILNDAKVFFVATTEDDKPRVRPFGFAMILKANYIFVQAIIKMYTGSLKQTPTLKFVQ